MEDDRCPNCKKGFDEPVDHERVRNMENRKKADARKRKMIVYTILCLVLITVIGLGVLYTQAREKYLDGKKKQVEVVNLQQKFMSAYDNKDWDSVINLSNELHRYNRPLSSLSWMLAKAYFHKQRYKEAVEFQRQAIIYREVHPDPKMSNYEYCILAKYLSFAYTETKDKQYIVEVEECIRNIYGYINSELDTPLERYRRFGAIIYRLDTCQSITDYAWEQKYFTSSTPKEFFNYVSTWLEAAGSGSASSAYRFSKLPQPW
jgi:hypothetical protein